jgi:hypothetical protein
LSSDHEGHADTLIVSAEVLLEASELAAAERLLDAAGALAAQSKSAYDLTHLAIVRTVLAHARGDARGAIDHALAARRSAERQALVSFHFYGLALEAAARAKAGEHHSATLLATTALGSVETLQGCEYGLEIRALCTHSLETARSPQAGQVRQRAVDHASALMSTIRDARLRRLFAARPLVRDILPPPPAEAPAPTSPELGPVSSERGGLG